jgi:hypothetical protein
VSTLRSKLIGRLRAYVTKAYPRRYPKMVVMDGRVFVAFESDAVLDGSVPFATRLDLSSRDYPQQIERARYRAEILHSRAFCTQCGVGVGFDGDGCCTSCGDGTCSLSELAHHLARAGLRVEIDALPEGSA